MKQSSLKECSVCGATNFALSPVLWGELISAWQLSDFEVDYINRQQGFHCCECGSNLRSMALASALLLELGVKKPLSDAVCDGSLNDYTVLEINEAGHLTRWLKRVRGYKYIQYPEYDMTNLGIDNGAFDIVIHSDTLEHIDNPVKALSECRRVLSDRGRCLFTIPTVVDRLTRFRAGLPPSYHGDPKSSDPGMLVHTEFGVDAWKFPVLAGFSSVRIHVLEFPAGIAYVGRG